MWQIWVSCLKLTFHDMSNRLSVLCTVYNEVDFLKYSLLSYLHYVDDVVIVEGAYDEVVALGKPRRSNDGTLEILQEYQNNEKIHIIKNDEDLIKPISDKDQRNIGLEKIKQLNPDGWLLIVDADEIYNSDTFHMIKVAMRNMERTNKYGAYFKSLTFINDMEHCTEQEFPRLFRITPKCEFVNDNYMHWPDKNVAWNLKSVIKIPYIQYFHMSFTKGVERFKLKRDWWHNRGLGKDFDYGWNVDESGKISDPNHDIYSYTGKLPDILKDHPLYPKEKKDEI